MLSSNASVIEEAKQRALEGAKQRVVFAEKWNGPAEEQLESAKAHVEIAKSQVTASRKEVEDAKKHLKSVEEEYNVIDVDVDQEGDGKVEARDYVQVVSDDSSSETSLMQIFVRDLERGLLITLDVLPSTTVKQVKNMVLESERNPEAEESRLSLIFPPEYTIFLSSHRTLSDYRVSIIVSLPLSSLLLKNISVVIYNVAPS